MAVTITNHQVRSADTPPAAGLGGGGWSVAWLPGRVLTEGQAAAIETAGAVSHIPADCRPAVYHEGSWSRADARAGQLGLTRPAAIVQASGCQCRVMPWPAAGRGVVAADGLGGDEDEQA